MAHQFNAAVALVTFATLQVGCGGYNSVTYMVPRTENGWATQKSPIGLSIHYSYAFSCNDKSISVSAPLVYSRRLAEGPFYIPIPYLKKQKPSPDISAPMLLMVSIQSAMIYSCKNSMVSVSSQKYKAGAVPVTVIRDSHSLPDAARSTHHCTFETPSISEIGDEFQVEFQYDLLDCTIPTLHFEREDSTKYIDGIGL